MMRPIPLVVDFNYVDLLMTPYDTTPYAEHVTVNGCIRYDEHVAG